MKYDFTEGTVTHVQSIIVDLEVEIRVEENACDFFNEQIDVYRDELKVEDLKAYEKDNLMAEIEKLRKILEEHEVKCDELERRQRYYKEELLKGFVEVIDVNN